MVDVYQYPNDVTELINAVIIVMKQTASIHNATQKLNSNVEISNAFQFKADAME